MAVAIAFLLLSSTAGSAQARQSSLVGTWRFVEITDFDSTGAPIQYYGDKPCGFIIYTATGQVSVHIARCPTPDLSPPELAATYNGYFGTYTVNEARGLVTHQVEGGSAPDYIGTLFHNTMGLVFCGLSGLAAVIGVFWLKKLIKVDV